MSDEDLKAEIERLKAENQKLKSDKPKPGTISFKVSQKGAISVYGLGRFPVTLYKEQWDRILDRVDDLKQFMVDHQGELKLKG